MKRFEINGKTENHPNGIPNYDYWYNEFVNCIIRRGKLYNSVYSGYGNYEPTQHPRYLEYLKLDANVAEAQTMLRWASDLAVEFL